MLEVVIKKLYSDTMISKELPGDALQATEEFVLVPVSTDTHTPTSGFYQSVLERHPIAALRLGNHFSSEGPLAAGEIFIVDFSGILVPAYSLAFAGIHRAGDRGWQDAPDSLEHALSSIPHYRMGRAARIATAGIPGTGFSGLKGGADPEAIRAVLEKSKRSIVVYHNDFSGDREPLVKREPQPHLAEELPLPFTR